MATRYCQPCAAKLGYMTDVFTSGPLQSQYQLGKFLKHTAPGGDASVFNSTASGPYANYVVSAVASGAVEIDDQGRRNFIYVAGKQTGYNWKDGKPVGPTDGVMVVLASEARKVHAFPVSTAHLTGETCATCGGPVVRYRV